MSDALYKFSSSIPTESPMELSMKKGTSNMYKYSALWAIKPAEMASGYGMMRNMQKLEQLEQEKEERMQKKLEKEKRKRLEAEENLRLVLAEKKREKTDYSTYDKKKRQEKIAEDRLAVARDEKKTARDRRELASDEDLDEDMKELECDDAKIRARKAIEHKFKETATEKRLREMEAEMKLLRAEQARNERITDARVEDEEDLVEDVLDRFGNLF